MFIHILSTIYEGEYSHGMQSGKGTLVYALGHSYEGEFRDNLLWGKGIMSYPDGRVYMGEMVSIALLFPSDL